MSRKFEESKDDTKINATDRQIELTSKHSGEDKYIDSTNEPQHNRIYGRPEEDKENSIHESPKNNSHSANTGNSMNHLYGKIIVLTLFIY
jgi:hypothetical protein